MTDTVSKIGCVSIKLGKANLSLLEALTIPEPERAELLAALKSHLQVQELLYVATCNRVEFLVLMPGDSTDPERVHIDVADIRNRLLDFFFNADPSQRIDFEPESFRLFAGREAVRHIFDVASSLDSIVIGESQILGQLKAAQQFCQDHAFLGPAIERLLAASYKAAKKVRTETDLGKNSVSMASLVEIRLDEILKEKPDATIAIVGSGSMTPKMADIIRRNHKNRILFVNRTISKVEEFAARFEGEAVSLDNFLVSAPGAEIIISSTSSPAPIFDKATLARINPGKTFAFDLAIPRDFCDSLSESDNLEIWNLEKLNVLAQKNRRERFRVVDQASRILDEQIRLYLQKEIAQMIIPLFDSALDESMALAQEGLSNLFKSKLSHLSENDRELLAHWSKKVLSHACYLPARQLARHIAESDTEGDGNLGLLLKGA